MPPMAYLTRLRLARAKELLRRGDMLVKDVAGEVGLQDPYYFMRTFKAHENVTPSQFANHARQPR